MAKNLFEQLLTKAGEIWSGSKSQGDHQMYIEDSTGLSGVAKYLAKQEQAAKPKEEQNKATQASGVEKYLARQQTSSPKAFSEAPTTGVGKYLARQASTKTAPAKPIATPKTGVGKYLAGVPLSSESKAASIHEDKQPQQKKPEKSKAATPAKKSASVTPVINAETAAANKASAPTMETAAHTATSPAPASGIIRFENITQCHASTVKGTQCKNTTNLTKIQRTINKKKYQFCACTQHNNDLFKAYPPLLETH